MNPYPYANPIQNTISLIELLQKINKNLENINDTLNKQLKEKDNYLENDDSYYII
ncbi:MAG: hypothetical protein IJG68_04770 [Bacilli bacterium]|nr:hypothetical protein [Bacilli bacterium]